MSLHDERGEAVRMRKPFVVVAAVLLLAASLSPALSAPLSQAATAYVSVTVDQYVSVTLSKSDLNMTVTSDMFPGNTSYKVYDRAQVSVATNCNATLSCPTSVKVYLLGHEPYNVDADIGLLYGNQPTQVGNEWRMGFTPGDHNNVQLQVSIQRDWGPSDLAGTYTGSITLLIYPQ